MSGKINIYTDDWCDLVFEGKNQDFGAYVERKKAPKTHLIALLIAVSVFGLSVSAPILIKVLNIKKDKKVETVVSLEDIKMDQPKEEKPIEAPPPPPVKAAIKFTPPEIVPDEEVTEEVKTQEELQESKAAISITDVAGSDDPNAVDPADLLNNYTETTDEIFTYVEQMPDFPGGMGEMYKYLSKNIRFPQSAIENGISGKVILQFIVDKEGKITNVKVVRSLDADCDNEAIRVVKRMPSFIPGKQNGKPVKVYYTLPINFTLGE